MYNRGYNSDYRYRLQKLAEAKGNLKLKLQHSKRNNSKIKNRHNNLSINNDNIINRKINMMNNNIIYNKKIIENDHSKDNKIQKSINSRTKVLSVTSNTSEETNYNNYFSNDIINSKNNNDDINMSNNENIDSSYIHITLNTNNPYYIQNITNISEEKEEKEEKIIERKEYENEINKKPTSVDVKYNIIVNKINQSNNTINHNNKTKNIKYNSSIKEKINTKDLNKNRVIKTNKRDLSAKNRQENCNSNKKINIKDKYNSNFIKNSNYSLLDSNKSKYSSKISCPINNSENIIENINMNNNFHYYSNNTQKAKNILSNINTITLSNNYITNYNNNSNSINHLYTNPNEDEFFDYTNAKNQELTNDEKLIYGDRIMKGYIKQKLLGKGGCGIVWLCTKIDSKNAYENKNNGQKNNSSYYDKNYNSFNDTIANEEYAVKQTSKKNGAALMNFADENVMTAKNEIKILCQLNNENNNNYIPKIYDYYEDNNDIWFSFEKGGMSISGLSFKIKGEFEKGERIYFIQKGKFLMSLFSTISQFKYLLKSLLSGIDYINKKGIIHSDIKPENILIKYEGDSNQNNFEITSIKIIDYGSAFYAYDTSSISSNTPEYLCPEITIPNKKFIKELKNNNLKYINCIDIWSLGITILELCLSCPIWMSYKAKTIINGKIYHSSGLFGCRGRDANKIYQKQVELAKNMNKKLKNSMLYLFEKKDKDNFIDLLKKMLELDYKKRITCQEAINHPFLND